VVEPLADSSVAYFALDNVAYHGRNLTIAFDRAGTRYLKHGCTGLCVWIDGQLAATSPTLTRLNVTLPARPDISVSLGDQRRRVVYDRRDT